MKMTYIIIGIILAGGIVLGLMSYRNKSVTSNDKQISKNLETTNTKIQQAKENPFEELRNRAFKTTPEDLELSLPDNKTVVYGVIMDWEMGGAVATTVSYQTGDASLYLSSGGGVIGGGQHQN